MIQQGDEVKLVGKVNYVDGYMAEVQVGQSKLWLAVEHLQKTISGLCFIPCPEKSTANPPDLGVSVGDGLKLGERLS